MSAPNLVERLVLFNSEKWRDAMEIPEGLLDGEGRRIVEDIRDGNMSLEGFSCVYIRGALNLSDDCEERMSPRDVQVVLEAFTEDGGSLANRVCIRDNDFKYYEREGNNVWEFSGRNEAIEEMALETLDEDSPEEPLQDISTPELPLTLYQNYPNPFNPSATIQYYLPSACRVTVEIYDSSGKMIARLLDQVEQPGGMHEVEWNGIDGHGKAIASGVYFYRLIADWETISRKMVLLR